MTTPTYQRGDYQQQQQSSQTPKTSESSQHIERNANSDSGFPERESLYASAGGVQWVPCDLPAWACRSCQQRLADQGQYTIPTSTRNNARTGSYSPTNRRVPVVGVDRDAYPSGHEMPASASTQSNAQYTDHISPSHRSSAVNGGNTPKTRRTDGQRHSNNIATGHYAVNGYASDEYTTSTTTGIDSIGDDPDWKETSSATSTAPTVRQNSMHDDAAASESSPSSDSGDEDYTPRSNMMKRRGTAKGKAVKRSRRG